MICVSWLKLLLPSVGGGVCSDRCVRARSTRAKRPWCFIRTRVKKSTADLWEVMLEYILSWIDPAGVVFEWVYSGVREGTWYVGEDPRREYWQLFEKCSSSGSVSARAWAPLPGPLSSPLWQWLLWDVSISESAALFDLWAGVWAPHNQ